MSIPRASLFTTIIYTLLAISSTAVAQAISSTTVPSSESVSSAYNVYTAIATSSPQKGNDPGGSPSDNPAPQNPETAGASGDTETAITLNTGDQIAIAVVVSIVVLLGVTSAILFYIAKKRQWEVRAALRRSARRLTTAVKARTPIQANFSRRDRAGVEKINPTAEQSLHPKDKDLSKRSGLIVRDGEARPPKINTGADRDVEKGFPRGFGTQTTIEAVSQPSPSLPGDPKTSSDTETPLPGKQPVAGKMRLGGWKKMFRR